MTKRSVFSLVVMLLLVTVGFACSAIAAEIKTYNEAPQLAELVKAGKLPPVHERLPENPMVLTPLEAVGGGDLRIIVGGHMTDGKISGYEPSAVAR